MSEGIWIAVITAVGAIVAAGIAAYIGRRSSHQTRRDVLILSPKDGEEIVVSSRETKPIHRSISGKVTGFSEKEIETLDLKVVVDIKTDKWYPQGTTRVRSDGYWKLEDARFGGTLHRIRVTLKDAYQEYASADIKVTVPTIKV